MRSSLARALFAAALVVVGACENDEPAPPEGELRNLPLQNAPEVSAVEAPLASGFCDVQVEGRGLRAMETDYLPHVLRCEAAHTADLEALKALAVAARSVAYYAMAEEGSICDGQGCQVYGCGHEPDPLHVQAVQETQGVYLMSHDTLTYGFYVAGDSTPDAACVGNSGTTEKWVTYNDGRSGTDVVQTRLGWRHAPTDTGYGQNRGCLSQWGTVCLEDAGRDWRDILRFYYGDDIEIVQAQAECIEPLGEDDSDTDTETDGDTDTDTDVDVAESGTDTEDGPVTPLLDDEDEPLVPDGSGRAGVEGCRVATPTHAPLVLLFLLPALRRRRLRGL
jgi:hypothetical protein